MTSAAADVRRATTASGLYAYAFVRADTDLPPGLPGIGREPRPVGIVRDGDLAVLVSDVDTVWLGGLLDEDGTADAAADGELAVWAREHDRVVRTAFERGPVLPFRFGTVLVDRVAADELLARRHDAAIAFLARVRDRVEWGIRLSADSGEPVDSSDADRSSGAAYLASRRRQLHDRDERRASARETAATIGDDLTRWAADAVERPGRGAPLDLAVLVDRDAENAFLTRVDHLAARAAGAGLVLEISGPWPPYSFARDALAASDG